MSVLAVEGYAGMANSAEMISTGGTVAAALIALASAAYTAGKARTANRDIEILKASLLQDSARASADLAYGYDARKRIYTVCEPLMLRLAESCDSAASRIIELSDSRRWKELKSARDPDRFWMLCESSELVSIAYSLLEPLAWNALLREKLTVVDFTHDRRIYETYALAGAACGVHLHDYAIASMSPQLEYDPVVEGWRAKRRSNPAKYWWQGLTRQRLDRAVEICIHRDEGRVTYIGEFEDRYREIYDSPNDPRAKWLGLFCNPLYDFRPESRPVFWRILMCQLLLYRRLANCIRSAEESQTPRRMVFEFDPRDLAQIRGSQSIDLALLETSTKVARRYIAKTVAGSI